MPWTLVCSRRSGHNDPAAAAYAWDAPCRAARPFRRRKAARSSLDVWRVQTGAPWGPRRASLGTVWEGCLGMTGIPAVRPVSAGASADSLPGTGAGDETLGIRRENSRSRSGSGCARTVDGCTGRTSCSRSPPSRVAGPPISSPPREAPGHPSSLARRTGLRVPNLVRVRSRQVIRTSGKRPSRGQPMCLDCEGAQNVGVSGAHARYAAARRRSAPKMMAFSGPPRVDI